MISDAKTCFSVRKRPKTQRISYRILTLTAQNLSGDCLTAPPTTMIADSTELRPLPNDSSDSVRVAGVPNSVHNYVADRYLATSGFSSRFVENHIGEFSYVFFIHPAPLSTLCLPLNLTETNRASNGI